MGSAAPKKLHIPVSHETIQAIDAVPFEFKRRAYNDRRAGFAVHALYLRLALQDAGITDGRSSFFVNNNPYTPQYNIISNEPTTKLSVTVARTLYDRALVYTVKPTIPEFIGQAVCMELDMIAQNFGQQITVSNGEASLLLENMAPIVHPNK